MNEMVERVARALHKAHYESGRGLPPPWEVIDRFEKEMWIFRARAGMEAMRRYSFDMEQACMKAMKNGEPFELVWERAFNVALAPTTSPSTCEPL